MRETITIFICIIVFIVALQTGLIRTGLDYETVKNSNTNLQAANDRLSKELEKYKNGASGVEAGDEEAEAMAGVVSGLEQTLSKYIDDGEVEVQLTGKIPVVKIYEKAVFDKDKRTVKDSGTKILLRMISLFSKYPDYEIVVTGYTNTSDIDLTWKTVAKTHRELAVMQATVVAEWLTQEGDVEATRVKSAGYGYVRPVVKNSSATNRRKNQFVEISLQPTNTERLETAREILKDEKTPVYKSEKSVAKPKKTVKKKAVKKKIPEPSQGEEVIGEDALNNIDEENFDAGYEMPGQDSVE